MEFVCTFVSLFWFMMMIWHMTIHTRLDRIECMRECEQRRIAKLYGFHTFLWCGDER